MLAAIHHREAQISSRWFWLPCPVCWPDDPAGAVASYPYARPRDRGHARPEPLLGPARVMGPGRGCGDTKTRCVCAAGCVAGRVGEAVRALEQREAREMGGGGASAAERVPGRLATSRPVTPTRGDPAQGTTTSSAGRASCRCATASLALALPAVPTAGSRGCPSPHRAWLTSAAVTAALRRRPRAGSSASFAALGVLAQGSCRARLRA
ncbi:hypothetical protein B0J12DRAFT_384354 [Macrophomina phaseolina]|uniref:Uncharacterized protein n=1 Tax=Macrophomina phaseolina TaxID=35725 RepID=A0ABQ8FVT5_9PEZI|nr:hypothetical protein B0J12DRAFT_384354 [Macrophomina phaseolina]